MENHIQHKENATRGLFFIEKDQTVVSELTYSKKGSVIIIDHVETKRAVEGQGLASMLMKKAVNYARENDLKIHPLCPFAEVQFEQFPAYRDVLMQ